MSKKFKKIISKLKTLIWMSKNYKYWSYALELIKRDIKFWDKKDLENTQNIKWCEEHAVNIEEALIYLKLIDSKYKLEEIEASLIREGKEKIKNLNITMGGEGDIKLLYNLVLISKAKIVVETGVAFGWSSLAILAAQEKLDSTILVSIDMPYPKANTENFVGLVIHERFKKNWHLIREPDINGIKKALKLSGEKIDLCHYDSDKSYRGRQYGYNLLWNALKDKGIFISDDIEDNSFFKDFVMEKNSKFAIIKSKNKFVGISIK